MRFGRFTQRSRRFAAVIGCVVALAASATPAHATAPELPEPTREPAVRAQATYLGFSAYNLATNQLVSNGLVTGPSWSTAKLIVVVTVLRKQALIPLTTAVRDDIASALRYSDNSAAIRLHNRLMKVCGGEAGAAKCMTDILRTGGAATAKISLSFNGRTDAVTHWGQTVWSTREQSIWFANLARQRIIGPNSTNIVLWNMAQVTSSQRWGLGQAGASYFKGGWGAYSPVTVRQVGLVKKGGQWWSVAIVLTSSVPYADNHFGTMSTYAKRVVGCLPARTAATGACF